jgi:cold shock CspA family protein
MNELDPFSRRSQLAIYLQSLQQPPAPTRRHQSRKELPPMFLATVSRWNRVRQYGFLLSDSHLDGIAEDREVYIHRSKLPRGCGSLQPGSRVEFTLVPSHLAGKQPQAKDIRIIESIAEAA